MADYQPYNLKENSVDTSAQEAKNTSIALLLGLCSCLLNSIGFIIMKTSHINSAKAKSERMFILQPLWIAGFLLTFIAIGFDTMAMNYGN